MLIHIFRRCHRNIGTFFALEIMLIGGRRFHEMSLEGELLLERGSLNSLPFKVKSTSKDLSVRG